MFEIEQQNSGKIKILCGKFTPTNANEIVKQIKEKIPSHKEDVWNQPPASDRCPYHFLRDCISIEYVGTPPLLEINIKPDEHLIKTVLGVLLESRHLADSWKESLRRDTVTAPYCASPSESPSKKLGR